MSVLDDAIREHLELRRRNGASEQEIAVKEAEALGPARRETVASGDPADEISELEETPIPSAREEPVAEAAPAPPEAEPDADPEPSGDQGDADLELADERLDIDMPEAIEEEEEERAADAAPGRTSPPEPEAPSLAPEQEPPAVMPERTVWRPLERSQPAPAADDVLEEIPDFLQETPEHERLWFEQRPPRDFDFDD